MAAGALSDSTSALEHGKPFAIVPCCVFPGLFPFRSVDAQEGDRELGSPNRSALAAGESGGAGADAAPAAALVAVTGRAQLVRWLARKTGGRVAYLDFQGANAVVWGWGKAPQGWPRSGSFEASGGISDAHEADFSQFGRPEADFSGAAER